MIFLETYRGAIEEAASKENTRYTINHVFFDAKLGHLVTTDGHILAVVNVQPEKHEVTGFIPVEAFKVFRKYLAEASKGFGPHATKHVKLLAMKDTVKVEYPDGERSWKRPPYSHGAFANYYAVMPKVSGVPAFSLNIELLNRIVKAIGTESGSFVVWPRTAHDTEQLVLALEAKIKGLQGGVTLSKDDVALLQRHMENYRKAPGLGTAMLVKTTTDGPLGVIMPMRCEDVGKWKTQLTDWPGVRKAMKEREAEIAKAAKQREAEEANRKKEREAAMAKAAKEREAEAAAKAQEAAAKDNETKLEKSIVAVGGKPNGAAKLEVPAA